MPAKNKPTNQASRIAPSPTGRADVEAYTKSQPAEWAAVCDALRTEIDAALPAADPKVWHGAPVWFIDGYPVVGYSIKARRVSLLFWNGRALGEAALRPVGKHFAAEMLFTRVGEVDPATVRRCVKKAGKNVFKDYASLRTRKATKASR